MTPVTPAMPRIFLIVRSVMAGVFGASVSNRNRERGCRVDTLTVLGGMDEAKRPLHVRDEAVARRAEQADGEDRKGHREQDDEADEPAARDFPDDEV